ncbi:FAD-binding oxidoreductase [Dyella ginsengisoli]|uniref:FAD-binding oxidoreductase n=1 Tax=Dyella ginsengisoli TaxID=363848 RepID=A0ABW8JWJ4_9GAMM
MDKNERHLHQAPLPRVTCSGFGGYRRAEQDFIRPERFDGLKPALNANVATIAPRGLGRSYGDAALNENGALLFVGRLDRFLAFDPETRVLRVEAGVRVLDIMRMAVPMGLTLAVAPGLSDITVGGCAAFDVHSKNHWRCGGFGDWVLSMRVMLASGEMVDCTRTSNSELFYATLGGLGLTGIIAEIEIQLEILAGTLVRNKSDAFDGLDDLFRKFEDATVEAGHCVAWLDILNGRDPNGIVISSVVTNEACPDRKLSWGEMERKPLGLIAPFFNKLSNRAFNLMYAAKHRVFPHGDIDLRSFLFPWDALPNWNRLYGKPGFVEYQCCFPLEGAKRGFEELISAVARQRSNFPAYFAAVKRMRAGIGMLSFPIEGYSLLLDFPVRVGLFEFLDELDEIVAAHGGRVYLAKDGRLSASAFSRMYPNRDDWMKVRAKVDPGQRFSSNMGRRLNLGCR